MLHSIYSKQLLKPICVLVCFFVLFSCEQNAVELSKFDRIRVMPQDELRATFSETFQEAALNSENYIVRNDKELSIDFSKMKSMRAFLPKTSRIPLIITNKGVTFGRLGSSDVDIENRISDTQFSDEFKDFSMRLVAFTENLEFMTYDESIQEITTLEETVENSGFDEFERIAMFEVLNTSRIIIAETFSIAQHSSDNGRVECETNWRSVARSAIQGGLTAGVGFAISWAKAGGIATTAAGQPWVGAIVGGLAGFTTGFIYGGLLGGGANYLSQVAVPDCEKSTSSTFAVDFVCLDPMCNERVPIGSIGIEGARGGKIYFVGG